MRRVVVLLALLAPLAAPVAAEPANLEEQLRAEIARLRESLTRAEALLAQVEKQSAVSPATVPAAQVEPAPRPKRAPALNTPPKLPPSDPERYRKDPPRFDLMLQGRFDHFEEPDRDSTFFLRKAELGIKAHVAENVDLSIELDPVRAPERNDPFRRTYLRLTHIERLHVKIGLEKAPLGLEELTSTAQIPFADRSEVTDRFAAAEEVGIHFESNWDGMMFQLSVTNGGRRLLRDVNDHKDVTARAVWAPTSSFSIGAATAQGKRGPEEFDHKRYNFEAKLGDNFTGLMGEFYRAKDADRWSSAFYVSGVWARPLKAGWLTHLQPAVRYEHIDSDDPLIDLRLLTLGFNLHLSGNNAKLSLNYLKDLSDRDTRFDSFRAMFQVEY